MLLTLLGLIPGIGSLVSSVVTSVFNAKVTMYVAKTGASRDIAVAAIQAQAAVEQKWWFVAVPKAVVEFACAAYFVKCVVWDTMLGWGSTPALAGNIGWAFTAAIGGMFASAIANQFLSQK